MNIPEGWPTVEMVRAAGNVRHDGHASPIMYWKAVAQAVIQAAPTPPAQEAEPVGEIVKFGDGPWGEIYKSYVNIPSGTKLYTAPSDELRQAAEEVCEVFEEPGYFSHGQGVIGKLKTLRSALKKTSDGTP